MENVPQNYATLRKAFYDSAGYKEFLSQLDENFPHRTHSKERKDFVNNYLARTSQEHNVKLTRTIINNHLFSYRRNKELRTVLQSAGVNESHINQAIDAVSSKEEEPGK